jgi:hypothetical protein
MEHMFHQKTKRLEFICGDSFPNDACPECYDGGGYDSSAKLLYARFRFLMSNRATLNQAEKKEYEEWIKPVRKRETEETAGMSKKEHLKWLKSNWSEKLLEQKHNEHEYGYDDIFELLASKENPYFKAAEWGVTCHACVFKHYEKLWFDHSGIEMITIDLNAR